MYSGKFPCSLIINKCKNRYSNKTDDSVHIRTQVNIDPVYFTFSPENYASFAQSWTVIISPNEVFGDIMVLASPPPRPPVDPDDVNALNSKNIQRISFKFYMRVDTPLRYVAIEIWYPPRTRTTAFAAKRKKIVND